MQAVTVSSKFQISLPASARRELNIRAGQRLNLTVKDGVLCLVPVPTLEEIRGSLKGLSMEGLREEVDRI